VFTAVRDTAVTPAVDLADLERPGLEAALAARGYPRFRARQIFQWIYKRGVSDVPGLSTMSDVPLALRRELAADFSLTAPKLESRETSHDGTEKLLLRLADGERIESVFIPDTPSMTFCISTQVGCAMACAFCLTGRMGLSRHLKAGEIVGQVRVLAETLGMRGTAFNIVLMGMGEPLHNYDETMKALRILTDVTGLAIPARRITLSTVGLVPALERLAAEPVMPNLAISLHAPTDEGRQQLVPVARKHGIRDIIDVCKRFPLKRRSRITFEYVLLAGVNDSPEDARQLARLLAGVKSKVNLIPLNAAPGIPFGRPAEAAVDRFARVLADHRLIVSVRKSRGRDIRAACGQLIVEGRRPSPAQQLAVML
jgi:23S rRNA (adenine2503-C2)-methyltransferase